MSMITCFRSSMTFTDLIVWLTIQQLLFPSISHCRGIRLRDNTIEGTLVSDSVLPELHDQVFYSLLQTKASGYFSLNSETGQLKAKKFIDRDLLCAESQLCCHTQDSSTPLLLRSTSMSDVCTHSPHNSPIGQMCVFNLSISVVATQGRTPDIHEVAVFICDENDHSPEFKSPPITTAIQSSWTRETFASNTPIYTVNISESVQIGYRIRLPLAEDIDAPPFHVERYELEIDGHNSALSSLHTDNPFYLECVLKQRGSDEKPADLMSCQRSSSGDKIVDLQLELRGPIDRERVDQYGFRILAVDGGISPPRTGTMQVRINVLDTNDHAPKFSTSVYETIVDEGILSGEIIKLHATDADEGVNALIRYDWSDTPGQWDDDGDLSQSNLQKEQLASAPPNYWFHLDGQTGSIRLKRPLDYEVKREHRFNVLAHNPLARQAISSDGYRVEDDQALTATATVIVHVRNVHDEAPHIAIDYVNGGSKDYKEIRENGPSPYFVAFITVSDPDLAISNRPSHAIGSLYPGINYGQHIDPSLSATGTNTVRCQLNSHQEFYKLDLDNPRTSASTTNMLRYSLSTRVVLDRERSAQDRIHVICFDSGTNPKTAEAEIMVKILDENDCTPKLQVMSTISQFGKSKQHLPTAIHPWSVDKLRQMVNEHPEITPLMRANLAHVPVYTVQLKENLPKGTIFARIRAVDEDAGANGQVSFEIPHRPIPVNVTSDQKTNWYPSPHNEVELVSSMDIKRLFYLNTVTGDISTTHLIDREENDEIIDQFFIVIRASDHGSPERKSSFILLHIELLDENDNPPKFLQPNMHFTIRENLPAPATVGEIPIIDPDFKSINIWKPFGTPGSSYRSDSSSRSSDDIRSHHLRLHIDPGHGRRDMPFILYQTAMGQFYLNTTRSLDRESDEAFQFLIIAIDGESGITRTDLNDGNPQGHTASATVSVSVEDVNDNEPQIIFPNMRMPNSTVYHISFRESEGREIIKLNAKDLDAGEANKHIHYDLVPESGIADDLFTIDRNKGFIKTRRRFTENDLGEHRVRVIVRDNGEPPLETQLSLQFVVDRSQPHDQYDNGNKRHQPYTPDFPTKGGQRQAYFASFKRNWHTDILLIVIVTMIMLLFLVLCTSCLYLRHKRTLFPFLPDFCSLCMHDRSDVHISYSNTKQKLDTHPKSFGDNQDSHSTYGILDQRNLCANRKGMDSRQHVMLDTLGMAADNLLSPVLNDYQTRVPSAQFHSSYNLNNVTPSYPINYPIRSIGPSHFSGTLPISPTLIGSDILSDYLHQSKISNDLPDVANQAETLHKQYMGYGQPIPVYPHENQTVLDANGNYFEPREHTHTYNVGGKNDQKFPPTVSYIGTARPQFANYNRFGFRPIKDDSHLYQRIHPENVYLTDRGPYSHNKYQHDLLIDNINPRPQKRKSKYPIHGDRHSSNMTAWHSDPSIDKSLGYKVGNSVTQNENFQLDQTNSDKDNINRKNEYYSKLHDAEKPADISDQSTPLLVSTLVDTTPTVNFCQYTSAFPKVQASFV